MRSSSLIAIAAIATISLALPQVVQFFPLHPTFRHGHWRWRDQGSTSNWTSVPYRRPFCATCHPLPYDVPKYPLPPQEVTIRGVVIREAVAPNGLPFLVIVNKEKENETYHVTLAPWFSGEVPRSGASGNFTILLKAGAQIEGLHWFRGVLVGYAK